MYVLKLKTRYQVHLRKITYAILILIHDTIHIINRYKKKVNSLIVSLKLLSIHSIFQYPTFLDDLTCLYCDKNSILTVP